MNRIYAVVFATVAIVLTGCSATQQMDLRIDGTGEVSLSVELGRVFREYYSDLSGGDSDEIFDAAEIMRVLQGQPGLTVRSVSTPGLGQLEIDLQLQDVEQLFRDDSMEMPEIVYFVRNGDRATIHIRFGRSDIPRFLRLSPVGDSPMIEYLLPPGQDLNRSEYIEYLSWAFEEYEGSTAIARVIEDAAIELRLRPEGDILVQRGGEVDGDTVVFRVPVIDLVLADEPYEFSVQFRAVEKPAENQAEE